MNYEAIWPLQIAKRALEGHTFSPDPRKSQELSEKVQEAIDLAQTIVHDFNEAQNEAFDVGWQDAAKTLKGLDWDAAKLVQQALSPHPFTVDDLKCMEFGRWVWVDTFSSDLLLQQRGIYVQVSTDSTTCETFFCCGWPGTQQQIHFPYDTYGHDWLVYPHRPIAKEEPK